MKISEIVKATGGTLLFGDESFIVTGFCQDTRKINQGDMYIPLIGDVFDGHDFIDNAFENGASSIITSRVVECPNKNVILVDDTLVALQDMARYIRENRDIKVIGITGSVGKTSTKDMIESVVSQKFSVLKTLGNYNNAIGLPLTMLRHQDQEVMILEMGMNSLGEIDLLCDIAKPDIAVITNIGTAHIGELGGKDNIFKAKMEITSYLNRDSLLVLNGDDDYLKKVDNDLYNVCKVGFDIENDLFVENVVLNEDNSVCILKDKTINIPVPGKHFVLNALFAIAVGDYLGIELDCSICGIEQFKLTAGRNDIFKIHGITCIDGTYNASEDSMKSTIDILSNYKSRKIAVLADMLELGEYSQDIHKNIGIYVAGSSVDVLYCVGNDAKFIYEGAKQSGMEKVLYFRDNSDLVICLKKELMNGDVVMLKGSNGMKLSSVISALKEI